MTMTRPEQNEAIAAALGFERAPFIVNGKQRGWQWVYPQEWRHLSTGVPNVAAPDFVGMLKAGYAFANSHWPAPLDYGTQHVYTEASAP